MGRGPWMRAEGLEMKLCFLSAPSCEPERTLGHEYAPPQRMEIQAARTEETCGSGAQPVNHKCTRCSEDGLVLRTTQRLGYAFVVPTASGGA
eukprot:13472831-Alexandrium_andersonii.AAC.1